MLPAGPELRPNVMTRINTTEEEEEKAPGSHGIYLSFSALLAAVKYDNGCKVQMHRESIFCGSTLDNCLGQFLPLLPSRQSLFR
jgi:hypothetical protein